MKIKYIANYNGKPEMGVTKKLLFQINSLNKLDGIDAKLILLSRQIDERMLKHKNVEFYLFPSPPYKSIYEKVHAYLCLERNYKTLFNSFQPDDVIFLRNFYPSWLFAEVLKKVKNLKFLDVVSNNIGEAKIRKSNPLYQLNLRLMSSRVANEFDGIIGVTKEIIELNFPDLKQKKRVLEIGNGFDPKSVPLASSKNFEKCERINFICVAHLSSWHGIERFLIGMAQYKGEKKIYFNVVGDGPVRNNLMQLTEDLSLQDQVEFHGFKTGSELDKLYEISHIGVGNLGTFKKGITITSPLKSREYCSRGLPFFFTCEDTDFKDFPYVLNVPPNDNPIDIRSLISYFMVVTSDPLYNKRMRNYAVRNLSWDAKMEKVVHFMKSELLQSK